MTEVHDNLRSSFLDGMSKVHSTVTVVSTAGAAGREGVTISAMSSVSADGDAPTLLICVHHESPAAAVILANGCFCISVLQQHQSHIANVFAGLNVTRDGDKFSCADWVPMPTGCARLENSLSAFDCSIISSDRVGTHRVFIAAVQAVYLSPHQQPLLYGNRRYQQATHLDE